MKESTNKQSEFFFPRSQSPHPSAIEIIRSGISILSSLIAIIENPSRSTCISPLELKQLLGNAMITAQSIKSAVVIEKIKNKIDERVLTDLLWECHVLETQRIYLNRISDDVKVEVVVAWARLCIGFGNLVLMVVDSFGNGIAARAA